MYGARLAREILNKSGLNASIPYISQAHERLPKVHEGVFVQWRGVFSTPESVLNHFHLVEASSTDGLQKRAILRPWT